MKLLDGGMWMTRRINVRIWIWFVKWVRKYVYYGQVWIYKDEAMRKVGKEEIRKLFVRLILFKMSKKVINK